MTEEQLQEINKTIVQTIEKTVNGKINRLDIKIDDYIKHDMEWKETVEPIIKAYSTANNVGDFAIWISKIILAVGIIVGVFMGINKINQ